jgi:hypothetical protein
MVLVITLVLLGLTAGAFKASSLGWGLPGLMEKPVSIREGSVNGRPGAGGFWYFGSHRRHSGGGYQSGK